MNEQLLEPQSDNRMEETAEKRRLKLRNPLKGLRGKKKRWLLLLVVIALAGGAVTVRLLSKPQTASAVTSYQEEEISQRDIVNSLSSSGTLQPADSYTVSTLVSGEILSDTFEEGDLVEEGQLLYTLDSSDASTSQSQAQNSYAQAQKSYSQAVCTGTGYLRNAGKGGMGRESVGKPAISKGLSAVWAGIGAAAYHLS